MTENTSDATQDRKQQTKTLVDDEVIRARVREILEDERGGGAADWSRHPLFLLFVGFLLTWAIGGLLTDYMEQAQVAQAKQVEQAAARRQAGIAAVHELASLIYERRTRAAMLSSSLRRNASAEELRSRKERYDESFVRWNVRLQQTHLTIRDTVGEAEYSLVESYVQYGLTPHFRELDAYLTEGFDSRAGAESPSWKYDSTKVVPHLKAILDCGYVITQNLWVKSNFYGTKRDGHAQITERADRELAARCPKQ